jgi:glyceraldehyde 3-phosphate dehydrogenase
MIPTTTGARQGDRRGAPELKGKLDGIRDARADPERVGGRSLGRALARRERRDASTQRCKSAAEGPLKGILQYCDEPLVSIDFRGNPHSSILDARAPR